MSEINLFNRWKISKKVFWFSIGGILLSSLCLLFVLVALITPKMGASSVAAPMSADVGWANEGGYYIESEEAIMAEMPAEDEYYRAEQSVADTSSSAVPVDRLIIRNGDINVQVKDTRQARNEIEGLVLEMQSQGAFVLSATEHGGTEEDQPYISMVIRVPAESFDNIMDIISNMAVIVNDRNEYAEDVTEEYFDLENRLESLEAARQRLLGIMEDADTTEDLLVAEQQLTQREVEIESIKGRMQFLSESAKLSRITIALQPYLLSQPIDTRWQPLETVRRAIDDLIDGLKGFVEFLIYFTIAVLPWLALFGFIIWLVVRFFKRRAARVAAKKDKASK